MDRKGGAFALEFEDHKAAVMAYRSKSVEVDKESKQNFTDCK